MRWRRVPHRVVYVCSMHVVLVIGWYVDFEVEGPGVDDVGRRAQVWPSARAHPVHTKRDVCRIHASGRGGL